jgi:F0F1-type ATP synthase delta subunit
MHRQLRFTEDLPNPAILDEFGEIRNQVGQENEIEIIKTTALTNESRTTIYIANESFYKEKKCKRSPKE